MIHMKNKSILACLLIVVLLFVGSIASAAEASSCTVTASKLILRASASADSEALTSIRQGTVLDIIGKSGKWYKVEYGNYTGYVYSTYVELIEDGTLMKGSKGTAVKELQQRLKELGYYDSTCDGDFGNVTVTAVKAFQKKNGLTQDGVVTPDVLKKINSSSAITAKGTTAGTTNKVEEDGTLKKGDKGTAVKELQTRLKELGYYNNTLDGDYGSNTVTAVKAFQKKNGLSQTGTADEATLKKVYSSSAIPANDKGNTGNDTSTTLKRGDKGTAVKELQTRLKELGYYNNTLDGDYGSGTVTAVKAFQKKNGLSQTGTADEATLKKVYSSSAIPANDNGNTGNDTSTTLKRGDKGAAVKQLQTRLKELGYYNNTLDGDYGSGTVTAVKAFQKKNGLSQTGTADEATLKKVYSSSAIPANGNGNGNTGNDTSTTLKRGDKGTAVKQLQTRLKELGYYNSTLDGDYGSGTVTAVKAFQKKNGLSQTGTADEATLKKVYSTSAIGANDKTENDKEEESSTTLKRGDKGAAVKQLQTRLKELGYYNNTLDGDYGSGTVTAVKEFQKKNGLSQTGTADEATLKKVYSTSAIGANDKTENDKEEGTSTTLKQGDKGTAVKELQQRLKELGYYTTTCDGDYGSKTVTAVKAFQKKNGLSQTGTADEATLKKVYSSSAIKANDKVETEDDVILKQGDKGTAVKQLQTRLKELGYYNSVIDGEYGSGTVTAVKAFQKKNGLTQTGKVDEATQKKLNSDSAVNANGGTSNVLDTSKTLEKGDNGNQVKLLQQRLKELGYYNSTCDGDYGYRTAEAVSAFQRANGLTVTGTANSTTLKKLVSNNAISKEEADKKEEENKTYVTEKLDWFNGGREKLPKGSILQIKDVQSGLVFKAKVLYGTNHLDAEPLTAADTAILLRINGGTFKWYRRPMLVMYNGHVYASSIYSVPHGEQSITDNNFDGQFCLHFYKSKTHGTDVIDQDHQDAVAEAMKATW